MDTRSEQPRLDLIGEILSDHQEIKSLLSQVESGQGEARKTAFQQLTRAIAMHETAEEILVHPMLNRHDGGKEIARGRLDEEEEGKTVLASLEKMELGSEEFNAEFRDFRKAVLNHAKNEEQLEHPLLLANVTQEKLLSLGGLYRTVKATAPTHPHPSAPSSALGNLAAGPFLTVVDHMRDLLRGSLSKSESTK